MIAGDGQRDDLLARLLEQVDEQLAHGTSTAEFDSSVVAGDAELAAEFEANRQCLEMLARVRLEWSPYDANGDTPLPEQGQLATRRSAPAQVLGRFRIIRELGAGGLGIVYLAFDPKLGRQVALKVPRPECLISPELRRRFLREAKAAARLTHPHLVAVYEAGEEGGLCYIASEFCPGPTLAQWNTQSSAEVPVATAARWIKLLAEAAQHAHSRGVLHRDIKPSNVLLCRSASGEEDARVSQAEQDLVPKLTDFGMAKLQEREGYETRSGTLVGTPAYMSPEQAQGQVRDIDARADVYALGTLLYELLTRRRVFEAKSDADALRQVLFDEPVPPRKLRPGIPQDLEAICLKCLAKERHLRYSTAQGLGDDLGRFLARMPTEARPLGPAGKLAKWARRRPAIATLSGVTLLALLALFGMTIVYNTRLGVAVQRAEKEATANRQLLYTADVRVAYETLKANNVEQATTLLDRQIADADQADLREFAWYFLREQCDPSSLTIEGHQKPVMAVAFAPKSNAVASGGGDGAIRFWDASNGKLLQTLSDNVGEVTCLAYSPDGQVLAAGSDDHRIRFWNPETAELERVISAHDDQVLAVAFSPDGRYLASAGVDESVGVWDVQNGSLVARPPGDLEVIRGLAFSPAGDLLYAVDEAGALHVWRTNKWQLVTSETVPHEKLFALAVNPASGQIAAAGRREVIGIWTLKNGQLVLLRELHGGHLEWIQSLAYSPDGDMLASSGRDGIIRIWQADATSPHRTFVGHRDRIWSVAWSPDGKRLASGSADGSVKIWSGATKNRTTYPLLSKTIESCQFSADGKLLVTACENGLVYVWDVPTRSVVREYSAHREKVRKARMSPDGRHIASRSADGELRIWNSVGDIDVDETIQLNATASTSMSWAPINRTLAISPDPMTVALLDVESNRVVRNFLHSSPVRKLEFTADGDRLVTTSQSLTIWETGTGRKIYELDEPHTEIAMSSDGRLIAAVTGSTITLVNMVAEPAISRMVTIGTDITSLAFSPDGRTIAAGLDTAGIAQPGAVSLWDARTQQLLMRLDCSMVRTKAVAFSPDGKRLLVVGALPDGHGAIEDWTIENRP